MKHFAWVIIGWTLLLATAFASDCVFIPNKSICGVSLSDTRQQYLTILGTPDGQISMGANRIGYVYGPRILLIFDHDHLWEVHAWDTNPNIDFWEYIANDAKRSSMRLVFNGWNPWGLTRKDFKKHDAEFPIDDEDETAEDRSAGKTKLVIYYDPCYSVKSTCETPEWETFLVNRISIAFHTPDTAPE